MSQILYDNSHCEDCDHYSDPILMNLSSELIIKNNPQQYFNDFEILTSIVSPNPIRVGLKCLIDTGALHGSYVGSWIRTLQLVEPKGTNENQVICSPISNSCVPITDSVVAPLSV